MLTLFRNKQVRMPRILFYAALGAMLIEAAPSPVPAHDARPESAPARPALARPALEMPLPLPVRTAPVAAAKATARTQWGFPVTAELPIGRLLVSGEYAWDDEGVPAGRANIVVNLRARVLSVYRSGHEIGRSSIVYGADEKPTPIGTFPILAKDAHHVSRTYGNAPMPFTLRLTADGVAIHGSEVANDVVTHGCVGLPREFAALLFAATRVGDKVVIWRG
jgi:lipoprotein-anchoring transpeptidase ErfK/SrfK